MSLKSSISQASASCGLNLFLAIKISVEVVSKASRGIIESQLLIDTVNLLEVLRIELEVTAEVGLDTRWSLGLGNHTVAVSDSPRERYLCTTLVVLLANLHQNGVILRRSAFVCSKGLMLLP
jgi:hypothetical protein